MRQKNGGRDTKVVGANLPASEGDPPARPFIGPTLTQEERSRAMSHAPKTHDGSRVLCWDAGTHRGCPNQECRNAHGALGKLHLLDPAVQMEIARRGGLKEEKKLEAPQAAQRIDTLRKGILKKAASDRNPARKAGGDPPGAATPKTTSAAPAPLGPVAPTVVIEEVSTGPLAKGPNPAAGVKVGLGLPRGAFLAPPQEDGRASIPEVGGPALWHPEPGNPSQPRRGRVTFRPTLRDALPTALEQSMTDLVNGPDLSWMEDAHAGQGRPRPIGPPTDRR